MKFRFGDGSWIVHAGPFHYGGSPAKGVRLQVWFWRWSFFIPRKSAK